MKLPNISIRKRLLIANFLMVFVPVCLLTLIGGLAFVGLKHSDSTRYKLLMLISPEKSSIFATQYFLGELRIKVEKNKPLHKIISICHLLEDQGINTAIIKDSELIYKTENAELRLMEKDIHHLLGRTNAAEIWTEDGFAFRYTSPKNKITILAASDRSFFKRGEIHENFVKRTAEIILYSVLTITIILIIFLGRYLAKLLSEQIARYENNRKELIAGISHDLATPLTAIKGYISGLNDGIANTEEKRKHYLKMMLETADNMNNLVESLFLFSKFDLGRIELQLKPVVIYDYFVDFVADKRSYFAERNLNLTLTGKPITAKVEIDYLQFSRVVENILNNSIKYRRGEIVDVEINIQQMSNKIKISFSDNGLGVDAENLPKLFESFYRTDKARSNVSKGSGLGLAIVKQIITALNGEVTAEKSNSGGLTIIITLPTL
ncbi:MAG: HAMP domain-containing histidine kinase [Selenomonadaceae bacterium]|nr:HAMP domain-containing histidine kinase [Selenomonadaceae bacterium]